MTRKLFTVTVAPVVDYPSSVWMHARGAKLESVLNRVQRIGGQAVIGCFRTVGTAVAEAEANIPTIKERHLRKAVKTWVDMHSMPDTHPLARLAGRRVCRRFISPMQKIAGWAQCPSLMRLETTRPYISAPWEVRVRTGDSVTDGVQAGMQAQRLSGVCIATSASARNELVGIGGVIDGVGWTNSKCDRREYDSTIDSGTRMNAYTAALAAIEVGVGLFAHAVCMENLSPQVQGHTIHVFTNNRAVLTALRAPTRRSGQAIVSKILRHTDSLSKSNDRVIFMWAPASQIFELGQRAKRLARDATEEGRTIDGAVRYAKTTALSALRRVVRSKSQQQTAFGGSMRKIDAAWPSGHTRRIYDSLSKKQASTFAQLRTGMTPLNGYLHVIKATETGLCDCGEAIESREHFIFHCSKWSEQRHILKSWTAEDHLPRLLGGKSITDTDDWKPDMDAVRAIIHFVLATKRFERDTDEARRRMTRSQ